MNGRERFAAVMDYEPFDRLPVLWFDGWSETAVRWKAEGLPNFADAPAATGMDPDWERGMWDCHGLGNIHPLPSRQDEVVEEGADYRTVRNALGALLRIGKFGECMPQHLEEALKPTRQSWAEFKKMLDPTDPSRRPADWEANADALNQRTHATCFLGGSLFGWPRDWMGVEQISYLSYDDPVLYEEIIDHLTTLNMEVYGPILKKARFEFVYFFEDCCGKSGPLFSPDTYRRFYHKYYRKLIDFYRSLGVPHVLVDSDGMVEPMPSCWMESGFDILFPIEVGTWQADPNDVRRRYGRNLRMFGGVDKHVISRGETAVRTHLEHLKPVVLDGGYIPIPDHRIPPSCSLEQYRTYVRVFKDVFSDVGMLGR
jgi:uroporphyrinogen decarboxylase